MGVIEYELLLDEERKPVLAKKNSGFSYADEVLNTPDKIAQMFMSGCNAEDLPEEHIWMLALNVKCKAIGMFEVAHGSNRNCMTSPRELFVRACVSGCDCIAVVHNHPSGICTPSSEARIRRYAEDILLGRAALKGNTADGTYHLERYEPGEEEPLARSMNIWKIPQLRREAEKNLREKNEQFYVAMEHLTESEQREVRRELGMETREDREQQQIDNFLKRMMDVKEHTTTDYGWLEPDGTFHGVEWGEHQCWADRYVEENFPEQYEEILEAGDWLVDRGWVLLHNPSQGVAFATGSLVRDMTKAQKEFLYDYYTERDCKREANEIWEE